MEFGDGAVVPVVGLEGAVVSLERVDGLVGGFVLERDEAGTIGGGGPRGHLLDDAGLGSTDTGGAGLELGGTVALAETPIVGILVPHDGLKTKDLCGDGTYTSIDISLRGTPVHGNGSSQIVDDLHGPTKITEDLEVGLTSLEGVRPSVNTKVHGRISLDIVVHHGGVPDDSTADEEVGSTGLLCLKVLDEIRRLRSGTIVKGDGDVVVWSQPDVTSVALLDGPRADIGHISAGRVGGGAGVGVSDGARNVRNQTSSLLGVVSIDPSFRQRAGGRGVGSSRRVGHAVLRGGSELTLCDAVVFTALGKEMASGVL